ncbi:hypothetical protein GCM10025858_26520 [Alicyclobacillus sacchari]|uniref:hypothetical protein n=1 Tax=Alicyclobacillus sacchari TaxID=392010 RepID=UPI0023E97929|nr:hypothetical protein [Alicyclobacillus sacchari]GMA58149.1 hypothetical protein GCM10025858_26520 [Alicyclobacillus sacchari]
MNNTRKWISPVIGAAAGAVIVGGVWFGTYIFHGSGSVVAMVGETYHTFGVAGGDAGVCRSIHA